MTQGDHTTGSAASTISDPYRELFERSADANLIIEDDHFVDCNQAAVAMLRCASREEVLRMHPSQLSPPLQPDGQDSFTKANRMIAIARERGSHRFEWEHRRADGEAFPVEVLLTPITTGARPAVHVVWRDISERRRLENAMRHAQKMEALGRLVGGIAHDFNNLLVAINGNADLLADQVQDAPAALELVQQIVHAGDRAAALVSQLLTFSRGQEPRLAVVELRPLLGELDDILRRLVGDALQIRVEHGDEPLWVRLGNGYFEQVVVNLVTNARDAMLAAGRRRSDVIAIALGQVGVVAGDDLAARLGLAPGAYARMRVSDCGVGMSPEVQARAFDPFFTTKEVGQGTGLGLATVYAIATRSGGAAEITSVPGGGTSVYVYLPLTHERPAADTRRPRTRPTLALGTVLVVEDESVVAAVVRVGLERAGFRVLLAGDGVAGIAAWRAHASEIRLVLSDVVMPHLGGGGMARELRAAGYRGPILFMSGFAPGDDDPDPIEHTFPIIEKPFVPRDLVARVTAALAAAEGGGGGDVRIASARA